MSIKTKARSILIVEDDKDMQEIYKFFFSDEKENYNIDIASNVPAALKKVKENRYDLIILDIIMKPMAGDAFYIYLRSHPGTRHLPVIIVSVLKPKILEKLETMNNVSILQKPIKKELLLKGIQNILS